MGVLYYELGALYVCVLARAPLRGFALTDVFCVLGFARMETVVSDIG